MEYSRKWKMRKAILDFKTCLNCRKNHGKIYEIDEFVYPFPPIYPNCRCEIVPLKVLLAGTATNKGTNGADWYLKVYGELPSYYITPEQAENDGWNSQKGDLFLMCPGKMIFVTYELIS